MLKTLVIGILSATVIFHNTVFAQVSDEEIISIVVLNFLLNSDSELEPEPIVTPPILTDIEDPIDIVVDGSQTSILFANTSISPLLSCSVIPDLPAGLSLRLVSEQDSCEIHGIATTPSNVTFYRVTGENEVGISSASVVITILAL
ncbi:MAG: hypothetical protein KTR16_09730 [Acidiferrobacterales bacterium]|nr:hypothetical protein [Acidiferrobacterales bacterium]